MLRRGFDTPLTQHGYLVSVELVDGGNTSPEKIAERFADSVSFLEDVGKVDVEVLGKLDLYDSIDNENAPHLEELK